MREIAREYGFVIALAANKQALSPSLDAVHDSLGRSAS
jgi:hypothetical protein